MQRKSGGAGGGKSKDWVEILAQWHLFVHKCHMDWPEIEPGLLGWKLLFNTPLLVQ